MVSRLTQRTLTFVAVGPAALWAIRQGSPWLETAAVVVGMRSAGELASLLRRAGKPTSSPLAAIACGIGLLVPQLPYHFNRKQYLIGNLPMVAVGRPFASVSVGSAIVWPLRLAIELRDEANGATWLEKGVLLIWLNDAAAYVTGSIFGGPKVAPRLSPNKTWIGVMTGMLASTLGATWYRCQLCITAKQAIVLGIALSSAASGGDLLQSSLKRRAGVKDSSDLLPGYGGMLDRTDSLLVALPVLVLLQKAFSSAD